MIEKFLRAPLWSPLNVGIAVALLALSWGANNLLDSGGTSTDPDRQSLSSDRYGVPRGDPDEQDAPEIPGPTISMPPAGGSDLPREYGAAFDDYGPREIVINDQFTLRKIDWATAGKFWGPERTSADAILVFQDAETGKPVERVVVIEFARILGCGRELGGYRQLEVFSAERVDGYIRYAAPFGVPLVEVPNQNPGCWPRSEVPPITVHGSIEQR